MEIDVVEEAREHTTRRDVVFIEPNKNPSNSEDREATLSNKA